MQNTKLLAVCINLLLYASVYMHACIGIHLTLVHSKNTGGELELIIIVTITQIHSFCIHLRYEPAVPVMHVSALYGLTLNNEDAGNACVDMSVTKQQYI